MCNMKFGKLDNVDEVDFTMPTDTPTTIKLLNSLPSTDAPLSIYFGCTGWSMKEWVGGYYPKGTKSQNFLKEYAKQFNTIEVNTTHYRIPTKKWVAQTPENFRFAPKIPQVISHSNDLALSKNVTAQFCEAVIGLGSRLGTSFLQLPPHFGPDRLVILEQFLSKFPVAQVPLSIEVRHKDWLTRGKAQDQLLELLTAKKVGTVMSDVAGRRDALHMHLNE